eukprot:Skav235310  [mRNA]  locus=scaffold520:330269:330583:- [translate_table: standard]
MSQWPSETLGLEALSRGEHGPSCLHRRRSRGFAGPGHHACSSSVERNDSPPFSLQGGHYSKWLNETGLVEAYAFDGTHQALPLMLLSRVNDCRPGHALVPACTG